MLVKQSLWSQWNDVTGQGGGVIQGTASEAVLVVLLAARDKALRRVGKNALEKLVVYASDQTHSALQKACQVSYKRIIFFKTNQMSFWNDVFCAGRSTKFTW